MSLSAPVIAAMLVVVGTKAAGVDTRPPMWTESVEWVANVKDDPVQPIQIGKLHVVVEKTTLAEARSQLGGGAILQDGDASESLSWLCYTVARGGSDETVWLSSSEMGGGEVIDGITAMRSTPGSDARGCTRLASADDPSHLANGLWLGATQQQVLAAFGSPQKHGDRWSYVFLGRQGEFDIQSHLAFKLRGGKVVGIAASRLTSN